VASLICSSSDSVYTICLNIFYYFSTALLCCLFPLYSVFFCFLLAVPNALAPFLFHTVLLLWPRWSSRFLFSCAVRVLYFAHSVFSFALLLASWLSALLYLAFLWELCPDRSGNLLILQGFALWFLCFIQVAESFDLLIQPCLSCTLARSYVVRDSPII
jgi:hypothetical protein